MKNKIILVASALLMTGCMQGSNVRATTVATGCPPDKVKVTSSKLTYPDGPTWTATCGSKTYYCMGGFGGSAQCSEAQK